MRHPPSTAPADLRRPELFFNRELSWLAFNRRVLEEAQDPSVPLLERLKFLGIVASNLDEFYMVRVAGLLQQRAGEVTETFDDGLAPAEQLSRVAAMTHALVRDQYTCFMDEVMPALAEKGLRIEGPGQLDPDDRSFLSRYFEEQVYPVLTPLAIDPGHPFPHLRNRSLNLAAVLDTQGDGVPQLAVVQVPGVLSRTVELPGSRRRVMLLEDVIRMHLSDLFPGLPVVACVPFRVTRNWDLNLDEEEADDLLRMIQEELRKRDRGAAVRLEIQGVHARAVRAALMRALGVGADETFELPGPLDLSTLSRVFDGDAARELRDEPFTPVTASALREADLFQVVGAGDLLLHHPYESFDTVVRFIEQAADDPQVLAIKMTLYRTGSDSPVIRALARAAENGKQVTAIVELKARFDEATNIAWARRLEDAGVHVVYGLIGLKTHAKLLLVVRREAVTGPNQPPGAAVPVRYVHVGTGNYNPITARLYTDLSLLTRRADVGEDVAMLFNLLTGGGSPPQMSKLVVAPLEMLARLKALIERESEHARAGRPARIRAKMNALVDGDVICALYEASRAGVEIDLIVRGICCLRPGVPGVSERIRVRSVVDRFLEHSRVFAFENGGEREVFLSSADWMPRNLRRRVEVMLPVEDPVLKERLVAEVMGLALADDERARELTADGTYARPARAGGLRSQQKFLALARAAAASSEEPENQALSFFFMPRSGEQEAKEERDLPRSA